MKAARMNRELSLADLELVVGGSIDVVGANDASAPPGPVGFGSFDGTGRFVSGRINATFSGLDGHTAVEAERAADARASQLMHDIPAASIVAYDGQTTDGHFVIGSYTRADMDAAARHAHDDAAGGPARSVATNHADTGAAHITDTNVSSHQPNSPDAHRDGSAHPPSAAGMTDAQHDARDGTTSSPSPSPTGSPAHSSPSPSHPSRGGGSAGSGGSSGGGLSGGGPRGF